MEENIGKEKNCGNCQRSIAFRLSIDEFAKAGIKLGDRLCSWSSIKIDVNDLKKSRNGCWRGFPDPFKNTKDPLNLGSVF